MLQKIGKRLKLDSPVQKVSRLEDGVRLEFPDGSLSHFDEVILACHADQSLKTLQTPQLEEKNLLQSFPYEKNLVSLHSDDSILPVRKSARASWNALLDQR